MIILVLGPQAVFQIQCYMRTLNAKGGYSLEGYSLGGCSEWGFGLGSAKSHFVGGARLWAAAVRLQ